MEGGREDDIATACMKIGSEKRILCVSACVCVCVYVCVCVCVCVCMCV